MSNIYKSYLVAVLC
ncbi:TPA: DUF1270 family protein, partial [Staphylococcus aureus]|nr:DUF1270 family protein [Staphylococcus aureus]HCX2161918.1 DUF1270 family protein [Staphylococcus aureus]HCX2286278.1 DUF1270 family protein [Staphylococcus aureus]HCX3675575.1 DUF1270 family protein [Staphylococcus aureus]HCX9137049.1 DUF1270 family protein [Staphylococcus aureus]